MLNKQQSKVFFCDSLHHTLSICVFIHCALLLLHYQYDSLSMVLYYDSLQQTRAIWFLIHGVPLWLSPSYTISMILYPWWYISTFSIHTPSIWFLIHGVLLWFSPSYPISKILYPWWYILILSIIHYQYDSCLINCSVFHKYHALTFWFHSSSESRLYWEEKLNCRKIWRQKTFDKFGVLSNTWTCYHNLRLGKVTIMSQPG